MVLALAFGLLLALLSLSTVTPVRLVAKGWVDLFRNLPLIFLILYLALSLPESIKEGWEDNAPGFLPDALRGQLVLAGILGLVLYNSAVLAEIMRAGILSLDRGQREAAAALGHVLPPADALRDPAAGAAPDGPGDRLPADHAQQGHDARLDHRDPGGRALGPRAVADGGQPVRRRQRRRRRRSCR